MPQIYTVASGDTLSAIAGRFYGNPDLWPALWWVNKGSIPDPNKIEAGQDLTLSQWHPQADWLTTRAMKAADPPPPPPPPQPAPQVTMASYQPQHADAQTPDPPDQQQGNGDDARASGDGSYGHPNYCGDGDGDGWDVSCQDHSSSQDGDNPSTSNGDHAPVTTSGDTPQSTSGGGGGGGRGGQMVSPSSYSGFQACVIARESGGNSQVMNSSGHYGLYQFAASTWAAYGGNPATFGHASVAEQNQVFANAMATPGGKNNWSPYDGC